MPDNRKPIRLLTEDLSDPSLVQAAGCLRDLGLEPEILTPISFLLSSTDMLPLGLFYANPNGLLEHININAKQAFGYTTEELAKKRWDKIIVSTNSVLYNKYKKEHVDEKKVYSSYANLIDKNGTTTLVFLTVVPHYSKEKSGLLLGYLGLFFDISHVVIRSTDPLTNLLNRYGLMDELEDSIKRAKDNQHQIYLIRIDIDNFSSINEAYGSVVGDQYLIHISHELQKAIRESDYVARIGGDEFGVIVDNVESIDFINRVIQKLREIFQTPILIQNHYISSTACMGISSFPDLGHSAKEIARGAQRALMKAKKTGEGEMQFDDKETSIKMMRSSIILQYLESAIDRNELFMVYQPQVNVKTGKLSGYEALLRWEHPELGMIPASEFIPLAEGVGLIQKLGRWAQEESIKQHATWVEKYPEAMDGVRISVNISARRLLDPNITDWLLSVLDKNNIKASQVIIELTETALIENLETKLKTLYILREYGFGVALDDFGTGYSSLTMLEKIPFTQIKIDQSFVKTIFKNPKSEAIVKSLINLSKHIGESVVAEGVETEETTQWLRDNGCEVIQGYYCSKPLAAQEMEEYIKRSL